jgi:predicted dehydrogenase
MLRVGFIGLGWVSHENVLGYLRSTEAEIVAVCCLSPEQAAQWLARHKQPQARYYRRHEDMLAAEKLDIVEILTPHHTHYRHAIDCARSGVRGISLQKPMANTLRECDEIIAECAKNGVILKVYENFLFYPVYVKAKQLIEEGLIGELLSMRVNTMAGIREGAPWPWCFSPDSWRGSLEKCGTGPLVGDDGFHKFSLARWFMGRDIETVSAWIDSEAPLGAPAFIRARFRRTPGERPKYAQIDFSFSPRMALPFDFWLDDFVEIVGERGILWINQCSAAGDREMFRGNEMWKSPVFPPIAVYLNGKVEAYLENLSPAQRNWSTSFVASTHHFIDVMRNGGKPVYTGEEGREVTRYAMAAYRSACENRDVSLDEITSEAEQDTEAQASTRTATGHLRAGRVCPR